MFTVRKRDKVKILWGKDAGKEGEIITVETNPNQYKEISRAKMVSGKCWSSPTVANGRIYVRSTKEGVCLEAATAMAIP